MSDGKVIDLAKARWMKLPANARQALLNNAFCHKCGGEASFREAYEVKADQLGLLLEGHCAKCGSPIARVIELE